MAQLFWLDINGIPKTVLANPEDSLAKVLREQLGLTGTKVGCGGGQCGACSVILDGKVVRSCITKMAKVPENARIVTIEGIGTPTKLHALQVAWMNYGGVQCGFCSPGFIVSAKGLLDENPKPTREEVRDWFQKHHNLCRCTGYKPLVDAVMEAAKVLRGEATLEQLSANSKPDKDGRIWNTYYPRPSALSKVTGTCDYGADLGIKLPKDALHIALVQPKVSHANIVSVDTSEAEKMPGVQKVVTHKDVTGTNRISGLLTYPWSKCDGFERPILNDTKIFQYGDVVAMVLADTKQQAEAAAAKVKVELEKLPAYMNCLDAATDDAIEIHPGTPNVFFEVDLKKGDHEKVDELMKSARLRGRGRLLHPAAAAHDHRARRGLRLCRLRTGWSRCTPRASRSTWRTCRSARVWAWPRTSCGSSRTRRVATSATRSARRWRRSAPSPPWPAATPATWSTAISSTWSTRASVPPASRT